MVSSIPYGPRASLDPGAWFGLFASPFDQPHPTQHRGRRTDGRATKMSLPTRVFDHVKEIFSAGKGDYINERGETVYGTLPRTKLENPITTVRRLSLNSWHPSYPSVLECDAVGRRGLMDRMKQISYVSLWVGWRGLWMGNSTRLLQT